ncbi:MAG: hypothetical protein GQ548_02160 [Methylophaga sp.]|nr:hypothetical protein [Methylophaga sp.]
MALIFQNVIVPNVAALQGTGKLLAHDAVYFDSVAWDLAQKIQIQGWSVWRLFPATGATGNVGILAALYALFGHDPSLMIPINACLHAMGGILLLLLTMELAVTRRVGLYAGVIAGSLFVVFPSALSWYGQLHKDSFAIVGTLLILLTWVKIIKSPKGNYIWLWVFLGGGLASALIGMVRPYGLTLLLIVSLGAMLWTILTGFFRKYEQYIFRRIVLSFSILVILLFGMFSVKGYDRQLNGAETTGILYAYDQLKQWQWQESSLVPDKIEKYIASAAKTRSHLIYYALKDGAGSTMDADITPENVLEVIQYLPRSLQISGLAPFPSTWFSFNSVTRLLVSGEMMIYYLCLPGLIFLLRYNRKPEVWLTIYFALTFLVILGFTMANLGTLHRYRFAYFFIVLMLGVLGWVTFLEQRGFLGKIFQLFRSKSKLLIESSFPESSNRLGSNRKQLVGASVYVMGLTFIGFIGFFYRDIFMANIFGLKWELDHFFIALLIPMTIVTIISMPLGAAFTPIFLKETECSSKQEVRSLVSSLSYIMLVALFFICVLLYFFVPVILPFIVRDNTVHNLNHIHFLVTMALPILFFSGWVILGNTILNALGKIVTVGTAQLIVPVVAILSVVIYGKEYGVQSAMIGMVVGQFINLLILQMVIKKQGYTLIPQFNSQYQHYYEHLRSQYFPLVASAFFVSIAILVNSMLAISLPEGNVSIYNLGSKIVLLITGLLGAGITAVMLPYFSLLVAKNQIKMARRELSISLLFVTSISIPLSVIFFVWAEHIVTLIFAGGDFKPSDIGSVARVMQYAVIQIPFFACNILLLKFATATKHVRAILIVSIFGLLINIAASLTFMEYMGVAGIALGASLAMVTATVFLVVIHVIYEYINLVDMVVILLSWLLFITLLISINFGSTPGIIMTILAYFILLASHLKSSNYLKSLANTSSIYTPPSISPSS